MSVCVTWARVLSPHVQDVKSLKKLVLHNSVRMKPNLYEATCCKWNKNAPNMCDSNWITQLLFLWLIRNTATIVSPVFHTAVVTCHVAVSTHWILLSTPTWPITEPSGYIEDQGGGGWGPHVIQTHPVPYQVSPGGEGGGCTKGRVRGVVANSNDTTNLPPPTLSVFPSAINIHVFHVSSGVAVTTSSCWFTPSWNWGW